VVGVAGVAGVAGVVAEVAEVAGVAGVADTVEPLLVEPPLLPLVSVEQSVVDGVIVTVSLAVATYAISDWLALQV